MPLQFLSVVHRQVYVVFVECFRIHCLDSPQFHQIQYCIFRKHPQKIDELHDQK